MPPSLSTPSGELVRLLHRPRYVSFVLTVLLSRTFVIMFNTAGVLLVLDRTQNIALAGLTAAAAVLPGAVSGPVLGAWLDVARRRRVLIVIDQLTSTITLLAIVVLAGHAPNWTVPTVAALYSVTRPFSSGTFFSALAELAGPELLDQASRIEATSINLSFVVGPALAGVLAGAAGAATAVEVQAVGTLVVAALVAINPAFEARPQERARHVSHAVRDGTKALLQSRILRATAAASTLTAFGWGLMSIGFPLYTAQTLHAGAHASGYAWAAMALGSILGTFILAVEPSLKKMGLSYAALAVSALAWPLVHVLALGVALVGFTGFLEGPAYSSSVALRQRHSPPALRAQVLTTLSGIALTAGAAGAAVGGAIGKPIPLIVGFSAVNLLAALVSIRL
jgi:MFS family permease